MGQACMNLMGMSIILGLNSALDTLVSQAAGAGKIELCGVYLNQARLIMTVMFIPILILVMHIEQFLLYVGQNHQVAFYAK